MYKTNVENLEPGLDDVVKGGYCSGCGACATISKRSMSLNEFGEYVPEPGAPQNEENAVCPFLRPEENENFLADTFLSGKNNRTAELGYFDSIFAAHVDEGSFRPEGSSGGMGTWLGAELLRKGLIDAVIHVKPSKRHGANEPFFKYGISTSEEEMRCGAHSHYHVVEISHVMRYVRDNEGRYLFVGVPCFAKAVRRLQMHDEVLRERIRYVASLICGHLKSINWSLSLGWSAGLPPNSFAEIKFRIKSEGIPAKAYYYGVKESSSEATFRIFDSARVVGGKFNLGAMMLNACNYCDDIVGETADISIGDAWLPKYAFDWQGKNMLVVRNPELSSLLQAAQSEGRIALDNMSSADAAKAQAGGFRQRREGLAYRIEKKRLKGEWFPVKREFARISRPKIHRRIIYNLRQMCTAESRAAFAVAMQKMDFSIYTKRMNFKFKLLRFSEVILSSHVIILSRIKRLTASR